MSKLVPLFFIPLFLFAFSAFAFHGKCHGKQQWWNNRKVVEQLQLSDQQLSKIDEIASSYEKRIEDLRTQLRTNKDKFKETMKNPNSTNEEILASSDQASNTKRGLKRVTLEMKLDIRDVLTTEQRSKLYEIKEQNKGHRKQGHDT